MDKKNLKKAALLGLALGTSLVAAPAVAEPAMGNQGMTLAAGCGSRCGGGKAIADADEPMTQQSQPGTYHSCNSNQNYNSTNNNRRMMPQSSCNAARPMPQQGTPNGCQARAGCGGSPRGY